jgi:hypothetical protein
VEHWDIGRQLIVKTVNQFIQNLWPLQSFASTFTVKSNFKDALLYCFTFEKGIKLLQKFTDEINHDNIQLNNEQIQVIKKMFS